uniref:S-adenosyl-l-methionine-dependent methyltransferase n=1 Tax=Tetraselmis sp. GSL018 TaxID=582737 RepID=A0A061QZZ2_9CHLO
MAVEELESQVSSYDAQWERQWGSDEGVQPGEKWDTQAPSPALAQLLSSGFVDVQQKSVVVPGCGRGYDLALFLEAGAQKAVGLEIAPSAVKSAQQYLSGLSGLDGREAVVEADFFKYADSCPDESTFDFGYDYTFFCAIHPDLRRAWADSWAKLLKPGGSLVVLQFPMSDQPSSTGPPWNVSDSAYEEVLATAGFQRVFHEKVKAELSHPSRAGREVMAVWRKL